MPRIPLIGLLALIPLAATAAPRPNVIVIMADDMGYSDLGCFGSEIATPNLDKLAMGGVRFSQFYNTARCCPTRAALLTGLYPHQAGVGHMVDDKKLPGYQGMLNDRCVTIAEALRPAGYRTYMTGKWHVTREVKPDGPRTNWPLQRGFDRLYGTIQGGGNYWDPAMLIRDNTPITPENDSAYQPKNGFYYTDAIGDHAAQFIGEHVKATPEKPFFLYCAFTAPHWPLHAREADVAKYKGKYDAGYGPIREARLNRLRELGLIKADLKPSPQAGDWEVVKDKAWEARCMEVYAAQIDAMDQNVGKIIEQLRAGNQLENTLIFFLQDNGGCAETVGRQARANVPKERPDKPPFPPMGKDEVQLGSTPKQTRDGYPIRVGPGVMPGGYDTHIAYGGGWANVSNTPFREYKHWNHEGGIATPLVAYWPKGITAKAGSIDATPGHLIDLMPTILEVTGAQYPHQFSNIDITPLEGKSLAPALAGKSIERPQPIFFEHEGNRAVRAGQWKLVAKGPGGAWELYDMEADRAETTDLAKAQPERVKELVAQWEAWAKRTGAIPWPWKPAYGEKAVAGEGPAKNGGRAQARGSSTEKVFTLKAGDYLAGKDAPDSAEKPLTITARLETIGDGVILAQGGTGHGFTLYVKDGTVTLAARLGSKLYSVSAKEKLPAAPVDLVARLKEGGMVTLTANGKEIGAGRIPDLLSTTPTDGLSAGQDANARVGEYAAPFKYGGKLGEVRLALE
ncbi:MAG TPA: arylsulfatase [Tepidisphaeraceae bacterium]|nr:arylsulfatase [Tepidisphaeraceae bacterium]